MMIATIRMRVRRIKKRNKYTKDRQESRCTQAKAQDFDAITNYDEKGFRGLPSKRIEFLLYARIKSVNEFMRTPTKDMIDRYIQYRVDYKIPPLTAGCEGNTIGKWKSDVRKFFSELQESDGNTSEESGSSLTAGKELYASGNEPTGLSNSTKSSRKTGDAFYVASSLDNNSRKNSHGSESESGRQVKRSRTENDGVDFESQQPSGNDKKSEFKTRNKKSSSAFGKKKSIRSDALSENAAGKFNTETQSRRSKANRRVLIDESSDDYPKVKYIENEVSEPPKSKPMKKKLGRPRKHKRTEAVVGGKTGEPGATDYENSALKSGEPKPKKRQRCRPRSVTRVRRGDADLNLEPGVDPTFDTTNSVESKEKESTSEGKSTDHPDLLRFLPLEGKEFIQAVAIASDREFLMLNTSELAVPYAEFRKKKGYIGLKGSGAASRISSWKRKIRDAALALGKTELASLGNLKARGIVVARDAIDSANNSDDDDKCAICNDGGDLILCDGCDKSYHLQCVNLREVPEGDWFCPQCTDEDSDNDKCVICNDGGDLMVCDRCDATYHAGCVNLDEIPDGDWFCPVCTRKDEDKCVICNDGGNLLVCDGCEKAYHVECVGLRRIPEGDWFCRECD
mmetsp:Transcript_20081/g.41615  ORF Transcript_20081/g.41615 Transcript_20081/m.41615 type:complete len:624 (-) Transcript_20081:2184-4055(-)